MTTTTAVGTSSTPGPVITVVSRGGALELSDNIAASVGDAVAGLVALPDAGSLPGELGVSNGAATYSLPIAVPPGTAGMVPSISLAYNSNGGNGIAGMGWTLNGLSKIQRCGKTILQDGRTDTVRFTQADRLCLDGQRLVLVNLPLSDTNYWADNAEYRTEMESFTRIKRTGGGFTLETKSGHTQYYGDSDNSRLKSTVDTDNNLVHGWALRRNQDRDGNAIDYDYLDNTGSGAGKTGEHQPASIRWGANTAANQAHYGKIEFDYGTADRPDAEVAYLMGSRIDRRKRLEKIRTYTDTDANGNNGTAVLSYSLGYESSPTSGRSMLQSVTACEGGVGGKCLPKTTFEWAKPDPAAKQEFVSLGKSQGPNLEMTGASVDLPRGERLVRYVSGDFNGDGKVDLVHKHADAQGQQPFYLSTGSGFEQHDVFSALSIGLSDIPAAERKITNVGDFNGDGQTDLLIRRVATERTEIGDVANSGSWKVCLSNMRNGGGFACKPANFPVGQSAAYRAVVDFNSDGRDDIHLAIGNEQSSPGEAIVSGAQHVCFATDMGFNCTKLDDVTRYWKLAPDLYHTSRVSHANADVDGDGRAETLHLAKCMYKEDETPHGYMDCGDNSAIWAESHLENGSVRLRMGGEWFRFTDNQSQIVNAMDGGSLTADINGDGYSDIMVGVRHGNLVPNGTPPGTPIPPITYDTFGCYSKGNGGGHCIKLAPEWSLGLDNVTANPGIYTLGDIDGDGRVDVWRYSFVETVPQSSHAISKGMVLCHMSTDMASSRCTPWTWNYTLTINPNAGRGAADIYYERSFQGADFTGDGRPDMVLYHPNGVWEIFTAATQAKPSQALDKLVSVTNGVGTIDSVEYAQTHDGRVYQRDPSALDSSLDNAVAYPLKRVPGSGNYVVQLHRRSNGIATDKVTTYRYAGAAQHQQGRGEQGYRVVEATVQATGTRMLTVSRQDAVTWQINGQTERARVIAANGTVLNDTVADTKVHANLFPNGAQTWFVHSSRQLTEKRDLDGSPIRTELECTDYGLTPGVTTWGNVKRAIKLTAASKTAVDIACAQADSTSGVWKTKTDSSYKAATANDAPWLQSLVETVTVNQTSPTATAQPRKVQYDYHANGLLKSETLEPDDTTYKLVTTFDRRSNKYGLVELKQQSWRNPATGLNETRTVEDIIYDAKGRYPQTVKNA
ncbi:SpvB/TcaC N-terminal domain-containing protein, partial [Chitinimonas viridis]